ncbi:MAG: hypothetical protein ACPGVU_23645, partial [Limisphaerales bacterium]
AGVGVAGPFIWKEAAFYLVVPTSVFGITLLPIAYLSFFLLINNKKVMGEERLKGFGGFLFNFFMFISLAAAVFGSGWAIWAKSGVVGTSIVGAFILLALFVHCLRKHQRSLKTDDDGPLGGGTGGSTANVTPQAPAGGKGETVLLTPRELGVKGGGTVDATPQKPNEQGETILLTPDDFNKGKDAGDMGETVVLKPEDFAKSNKTAAAPVKIKPKNPTPEGSGDPTTLTGPNLL